jgi:hypothetical protein
MADDRPVPDWLLERLAAGELPASEAARLRARLEAKGELGRLQALESSNREILAAHPPASVAVEVQRRAQRHAQTGVERNRGGKPVWRRAAFPGLALCAAGLAVVFALERGPRPGVVELPGSLADPEVTRTRGLQPHLAVYRKRGEQVDRLKDGASARAGELLQIAYVAAGRRHGVIASVDARGMVTLHLPEAPGPAARLQSGKEIALAGAFELDATPGFERFVFVTSDDSFDTAEVAAWLRKGGPPLPAGRSVFALTLAKSP